MENSKHFKSIPGGMQITLAWWSKNWQRLPYASHPLYLHSDSKLSFPLHWTLLIHVTSVRVSNASGSDVFWAPSYPSWRQTTFESFRSHESGHTVPQTAPNRTSTTPRAGEELSYPGNNLTVRWKATHTSVVFFRHLKFVLFRQLEFGLQCTYMYNTLHRSVCLHQVSIF